MGTKGGEGTVRSDGRRHRGMISDSTDRGTRCNARATSSSSSSSVNAPPTHAGVLHSKSANLLHRSGGSHAVQPDASSHIRLGSAKLSIARQESQRRASPAARGAKSERGERAGSRPRGLRERTDGRAGAAKAWSCDSSVRPTAARTATASTTVLATASTTVLSRAEWKASMPERGATPLVVHPPTEHVAVCRLSEAVQEAILARKTRKRGACRPGSPAVPTARDGAASGTEDAPTADPLQLAINGLASLFGRSREGNGAVAPIGDGGSRPSSGRRSPGRVRPTQHGPSAGGKARRKQWDSSVKRAVPHPLKGMNPVTPEPWARCGHTDTLPR